MTGLPDGAPIPAEEAADVVTIVAFAFPEAGRAGAQAAVDGRAARTYA